MSPLAPPPPRESPPLHSQRVERLRSLLDRWVARVAQYAVLTMIRRGDRSAIVLTKDEYEGYMETLEIMHDEEAQRAIREGEQDAREGRLRDYEDVRRDLGIA